MKLEITLIPTSSHFRNVRTLFVKEIWDKIRKNVINWQIISVKFVVVKEINGL